MFDTGGSLKTRRAKVSKTLDDLIIEMKRSGKTWRQISDIANRTYGVKKSPSAIRTRYGRLMGNWKTKVDTTVQNEYNTPLTELKNDKKTKSTVSNANDNVSVEYNANNDTYTRDKLIEVCECTELTPEVVMEAHNLDPSEWEVVNYRNNYWHSQVKGGKRLVMYQSRLTVKPNKKIITCDFIDKYFADKRYDLINDIKPKQYDKNGETLEIDITDLHNGLLSWEAETGSNYDINIARELFIGCIHDIVERCKGRKFKRVIIANLGDIIHIDNNANTTTRGTPQQADSRLEKIIDSTIDNYIIALEMLAEIAPLHFIYCKGNHDEISGYALVKALQMAFRKCKSVTFDITPNPFKVAVIGKSLVGFGHGNLPKNKNADWIVNDYRLEFGKTKYAEIHYGHTHHQTTEEKGTGVVVRYLPALCSASAWEHVSGYRAYKAMVSFVWHDTKLLRDMWFNFV